MTYPAITLENIGKRYSLGYSFASSSGNDTLVDALSFRAKNILSRITGKALATKSERPKWMDVEKYGEFWALRNLSFEIKSGEVVGIIGRNGAGKSTVLKIISRITEPSEGRLRIRGRVASLLEVGTGFHPQLSGLDNIYLNGAILGMTKVEIKRRLDEIIDFAGVEKFLETPIKRYSSGMQVRLAFAVAAHLEPEILIVDEVLAVGDVAFQKKCLGKMQDVATNSGRTVLFVSHNMAAVRQLCQKTIWLKSGQLHGIHPVAEGIQRYLSDAVEGTESGIVYPANKRPAQITSISLMRSDGTSSAFYSCGEPLVLELKLEVREPVQNVRMNFTIKNGEGLDILFSASRETIQDSLNLSEGVYTYRIPIPERLLAPGFYVVGFELYAAIHGGLQNEPEAFGFNLEEYESQVGGNRRGLIGLMLPWHRISEAPLAEIQAGE